MPNFNATLEDVADSVVVGKYVAKRGWKIQLESTDGDSLTHTHKWTYRSPDDSVEIVFWFDPDYSLSAAVKYRVFDSITAFPVAGTRDLFEAMELLQP